ncbi:MAG TPA: hypothetical protein VFH46_16475, partial [Pyrinomonadaceae bacterium]|nr:hypothetical protein [Pyrinomonadaceae bacterium]
MGLLENLSVARPDSPTNLIANRHLRDVLQAKGYSVELQEINGGHDFFNWQASLADGLISLLNTKKEKRKNRPSLAAVFRLRRARLHHVRTVLRPASI